MRMLNTETADSKNVLLIVPKEIFETLNYILSFLRRIPSISKITLDLAIEKLAVYCTCYRDKLSHIPKKQSIHTDSMAEAYTILSHQKDRVVESISKAQETFTSTMKSIPSLPNLPIIPHFGLKFSATNSKHPTASNGIPETNLPNLPNSKPTNTSLNLRTSGGVEKTPSSSNFDKLPQLPKQNEEVFPSLEGTINLLNLIHYEYTLGIDNRAVQVHSQELAYPVPLWKSPPEYLAEQHHQSTDNLALILRPVNSTPQYNVIGNVSAALNSLGTHLRPILMQNSSSTFSNLENDKSNQKHLRVGSEPQLPFDNSHFSISTTPRDSFFLDKLDESFAIDTIK
jgi:hypothetical protein